MIGTPEHEKIKARKRERHKVYLDHIRESPKCKIRTEKKRNIKSRRYINDGFMERVNAFKTQIQECLYYICINCNRCLQKRLVFRFGFNSFKDLNENISFCVDLHDGKFYICLTYDRKLKKNLILCQAVANKLAAERLPSTFEIICRFERVLVSRRVLFKTETVIPKGPSPKLKGSICNIPISEVNRNFMSLP